MSQYYVYIITNTHNTTLYVGVTRDLGRRIYEHKEGLIKGFTKKYQLHKLVYSEAFNDINEAIAHEKRVKRWKRAWKDELVEASNPEWIDQYAGIPL